VAGDQINGRSLTRAAAMTFVEWKAAAFVEYLRLSSDSRREAEMYFDHINVDLYNMYRDGTTPQQAVRELMFDDEHQ
jgi:hypothetical protein